MPGFDFRKFDEHFSNMFMGIQKEVSSLTGCLKPCFYSKYILQGEKRTTFFK